MATLAEYHDVVIDSNGNAVAGATVSVANSTTGAAASLFSDRGGATALSNPLVCDAYGRFQFFIADTPNVAWNITQAGGSISSWTRTNVEIRSVEAHSDANPIDHPDGSISANKLNFPLDPAGDLAVHQAKTTAVHGAGANHIPASTTNTGTSPTFVNLTTSTWHSARIGKVWMVRAGVDDLATVIAGASNEDTIFLDVYNPGGAEHDLTITTLTKTLHFVGRGASIHATSANGIFVLNTDASGTTFEGIQFRFNETSIGGSNPCILFSGAQRVTFDKCYFLGLYGKGIVVNHASSGLITVRDCTFDGISKLAIQVIDCDLNYGMVRVLDSYFTGCNYADPTGNGTVRFNNPASGYTGGHKVERCVFDQINSAITMWAEAPRCTFKDNHSVVPPGATYLAVSASATMTYSYNNTQYTGGAAANVSDVAGNIVGGATGSGGAWDYISAIIAYTPSTAPGTPEAEEINNPGFNHALNTKLLEAALLCSDTADFSGKVWPVAFNTGVWQGNDDTVELIFTDNNTARLFVHTHNVNAGGSALTMNAVQQRIDPASPGTLFDPQVNFNGSGGNYYTATFWRLALKRIQ